MSEAVVFKRVFCVRHWFPPTEHYGEQSDRKRKAKFNAMEVLVKGGQQTCCWATAKNY